MKDERLSIIREVVNEINSISKSSLKFDIHSSSIKYQGLILFISVCEPFKDHDSYKEYIYKEVRKSLKEIREELDSIEKGC